jgi:hypothetical protein
MPEHPEDVSRGMDRISRGLQKANSSVQRQTA